MVDGVVGLTIAAAGVAVGALVGSDVGLVADDGVEARSLALAVKLDGPVEVAMVGDGHGIHAQLLDVFDQFRDTAGTVEKTVMSMAVQMNKGPHRH